MNIYDNQRDREVEEYSQELFDEYEISIQSKKEACINAIAYLEESYSLLSNAKDNMKELVMFSNVTDIKNIMDDIKTNIMELEIKKATFI